MNEKETKQPTVHSLTEEILAEGLQTFAEQTRKLSEDIARFNARHEQMQEEIKRGGTQTNGRIV